MGVDTLRAWERRYGLLRPQRSPGGFRLYGTSDEERVRAMKALIDSGVSAAEAARLAASEARAERQPSEEATDHAERLAVALDRFDEADANAILDDAIARFTVDAVASRVLLPVLHEIGTRWESGEISVAEEHFATALLRGRMLALGRNWGAGRGPLAVLACPPGELHDLGLIAFGLVLRERGWRIALLGSDTPIGTIADAVAKLQPGRGRSGGRHPGAVRGRRRRDQEPGRRNAGADRGRGRGREAGDAPRSDRPRARSGERRSGYARIVMGSDARTALVTGATGFIGGRLANALADDGWRVRALVRDRGRAGELAERGIELVEGDVLDAESLRGAGDGVEVAYYLVHGMGRGGEGDFEEREREAARNFAEMAKREGVERVVYLGGLGDQPRSKHLRSRAQTAEILRQHGPPLTYFRAAMVVGARSESYRTLRYLVQRLPAMIAPSWLSTPTQPIAVDDVIAYLKKAPDLPESTGREIQIGGPDVLSYGDMLDRMAHALKTNPRPRVPVPLLTPWLSSLWIGLVTPVDAGVARPLIEGLSTPTTVTDPSGAEPFGIEPVSFAEALRRALAEDSEVKISG